MKNNLNLITLGLLAATGISNAAYSVKIPLDIERITFYEWNSYNPILGQWEDHGAIYGCDTWSPPANTITIGQSFVQTATDCKQDQIRKVQDREVDKVSGNIRNKGEPYTQSRTIDAILTREVNGTLETWIATTPTYTAWVNSGAITSCTNWSPAPSTKTIGESFTQTATDCKQDQTRSRQDREQETTTKAIRNKGTAVTETQTITVSSTRNATGTLETWIATTPTYTTWVNSGAITSCTNWSPAPSTKTIGESFIQTATDCKQDQTRSRQDREQETTTKAIRNKGTAVTETQTITVSSTRNATGTKETWAATTPTYTAWVNNGAIASCTNWSPAPSTKTIGESFIQTATDCKQDQTRSRQDREQETTTKAIRNKGTTVTETQTITVSSTRNATGTKEIWVAATPTYTAWVNTNTLHSCSNWTPAGSTKTTTTTFTQTATNCKTDQSRTRQDREQETTTKAYRNKGSVVTETQTLSNQSATRSYTVTLGVWTNSGLPTDCSNWLPDPSTVNFGDSFTQTATDCSQKQTRSRIEKYVDHISGSTIQASNTSESQTLDSQKSTRAAVGTKPIKQCSYSDSPAVYWRYTTGTDKEHRVYSPNLPERGSRQQLRNHTKL